MSNNSVIDRVKRHMALKTGKKTPGNTNLTTLYFHIY